MSLASSESPDTAAVETYLLGLQDEICGALEKEDGKAVFHQDRFEKPGGGVSQTRVLSGGALFEQAAVNFSHARGPALPSAATARRLELEGRRFEAVSVSLIVHPENPYVPTTHANVRFFIALAPEGEESDPVWWFGGGFDLTPYYGFEEDAVHWHGTARRACEPFGAELYPRLKETCDRYFFLPHRGEPRGIGGLFYDDDDEGGFATAFARMRSVGDHFLPAYLPIVQRRRCLPWGERERDFQLYRRGRYVEFNLIHDRGTRFGLQAGGRAESILASLPPLVKWRYDWQPEAGSEEARLYEDFLRPRDWLRGAQP